MTKFLRGINPEMRKTLKLNERQELNEIAEDNNEDDQDIWDQLIDRKDA